MSAVCRSWREEKRERERAIVWLLRGCRYEEKYEKEDAWLDGWHPEGLRRSNAIKIKRYDNNRKTRYLVEEDSGGAQRFC